MNQKPHFKKQDHKYKQITALFRNNTCVREYKLIINSNLWEAQMPGALKTLNHKKLVLSTSKKVTIIEKQDKTSGIHCSAAISG